MYIIGSKDLVAILEAINSITNWHTLGLKLPGLEEHELQRIERNYRGIVDDCQREMILQWLHTGQATWSSLVHALMSPLVNRKDLALQIAQDHQMY